VNCRDEPGSGQAFEHFLLQRLRSDCTAIRAARNDLPSRCDETGKHYGGFLLTLLDQVGGIYRVNQ